jgi:hypothetical protein
MNSWGVLVYWFTGLFVYWFIGLLQLADSYTNKKASENSDA